MRSREEAFFLSELSSSSVVRSFRDVSSTFGVVDSIECSSLFSALSDLISVFDLLMSVHSCLFSSCSCFSLSSISLSASSGCCFLLSWFVIVTSRLYWLMSDESACCGWFMCCLR